MIFLSPLCLPYETAMQNLLSDNFLEPLWLSFYRLMLQTRPFQHRRGNSSNRIEAWTQKFPYIDYEMVKTLMKTAQVDLAGITSSSHSPNFLHPGVDKVFDSTSMSFSTKSQEL